MSAVAEMTWRCSCSAEAEYPNSAVMERHVMTVHGVQDARSLGMERLLRMECPLPDGRHGLNQYVLTLDGGRELVLTRRSFRPWKRCLGLRLTRG